MYIKKYESGTIVKLITNRKEYKSFIGMILEGPFEYGNYKILKNSGEIVWLSHSLLINVQI